MMREHAKTDSEIAEKAGVLRAEPVEGLPRWREDDVLPLYADPKVTAIQEAKDLKTFPLEELIGSLMTYEMTCHAHEELENPLPKNRKDMTLRT
ncbi:hypothetical protein MUK42_22234 [Musa troglodytarum]|uniref:Uncharacterized protein n=1 Tax=Musa troglodytarum TaxID=320322 RepID=A0A9E7KVI3_9LILI|nr:hypothetical protein MUK42_22234 [Musa troglodytarum]